MLKLKLQYFGHLMQRALEKTLMLGKDWRQEEKGTTEDEMLGWHHWLDGHEFEQAPGDGEGQGSPVCCCPWRRKESDTTERQNNSNNSSPKFSTSAVKGVFLPPSTGKAPFTEKIYFLLSGRQKGEIWLTTKFCSADNAGTKNAFHVEAVDIVLKKT